jgi:hypothetical protein
MKSKVSPLSFAVVSRSCLLGIINDLLEQQFIGKTREEGELGSCPPLLLLNLVWYF